MERGKDAPHGGPQTMIKQAPDHHDADLVLKLYDLRREAVMRQSRSTIVKWIPRTYEEVVAITNLSHPDNAAWRQVSSYFEICLLYTSPSPRDS